MLLSEDGSRSCRPLLPSRLRLLHQTAVGFLTIDAFVLAAVHFVVTSVKHFPRISQLVVKADHGIFDNLGRLPASLTGHFLKLGLYVWAEIHFHRSAPSLRIP